MSDGRHRIYGLHAAAALLQRDPALVQLLWLQEGRRDARLVALREQAEAAGVAWRTAPRRQLDEWVGGAAHQGVVGEIAPQAERREADLPRFLDRIPGPPFLLVLDGVQDPHNLGACLRTADAAGVHALVLPRDRAAGLTPVVHKVACGAAATVPVFRVTNLARALRGLRDRGIWIYGASGEAETSLYQTALTGPLALVLGAEGRGLRRLTREHCDALMRIPMRGTVASLNVSVAAGVVLFEALRQRLGAAGGAPG